MRIMLVTADREVLSLIEEESKIKRFDLVTVLPSEQWWNLQREGLDSSVDPILIDLAIAAPGTRKEWATLRASWPDSRIIGFTRRMDDDLIE